ncbi:hypothetical protein JCM6294_1060 [Bacteroides pyogenes DSM 20611 = JCM 6294]|uniref:Uncharacterized protein n=1 Tax=Bacteroides pyogenes DSM 20611 = JCM 6294 TaxID=1121100 RepID=W4PEF1_9BACE|nr:hypothetical protein JCM6294_1060 [Bacteroides pyogenes DSM 20611 = JCM 6294]
MSFSDFLLVRTMRTPRQVLVRALTATLPKSIICGIINKSITAVIALRLNGDKSKEMWNVLQNHQADNSLTLEHPVFSYMFRV